MTGKQRQTNVKCKQFVNFSKNIAFFAKNLAIYEPAQSGNKKQNKGELKWEWQSTMKTT